MRQTFTWTVAIALAAVGCGSDSSPADSSSGGTDAIAGSSSAGGPSAIGGAVQTNAGGNTFSAAGSTSSATAGQPGTAASAAGSTNSPELVGGTSPIGVGGVTMTTDSSSSSTGGTGAGGVNTTTGGTGAGGVNTATGGASTAAAGSCAVTYYRDADGDTWGAGESSCTGGAGWVTRTGDCKDDDANVFPEQTTTFAVPYVAGNGTQSFDYNCDGSETIAGGTQLSTGACETAGLGNACSGDGYLPVEPVRTGSNLNQLCGSMRYLVCARSQQVCIGAVSTDGTYQAAACK